MLNYLTILFLLVREIFASLDVSNVILIGFGVTVYSNLLSKVVGIILEI